MSRGGFSSSGARAAFSIVVAGLLLFLLAPLVVVAGASFGAADVPYVAFPPRHFSLHWYTAIPRRYVESIGVSLVVAFGTSLVSVAIAIPTALGLGRSSFHGKWIIATLMRAPLQIPYVVIGIGFLQAYYLFGAATGFQLRGTYLGLLAGHVLLATPYAIGSITAVASRFDIRLEEAAASLGANPWRTFRRVTLPIILPGVYAAALYAFIVSFGEVPVALFLGGPGRTTFPVELFSSMQFDFSPALLAISTIVLILSFAILMAVQRWIRLDQLLHARSS